MPVFKLVYKLLKENKISILVTIIVVIAISVLFVKTGSTSSGDSFQGDVKPSIAIIDYNRSEESKDLYTFLEERAEIVELGEKEIEDALFYQQIVYVLYIPKTYSEDVYANKVVLEKKVSPNAAGSFVVNQYVEEYLTSVQNYIQYMPQAPFSEIQQLVQEDFSNPVKVEVEQVKGKEPVQAYFNFFAYSLLCSLGIGIGYSMSVLSERAIKRRNVVSPMSHFKFNIQQVLAYICFAFMMLAIAVGVGYLLFFEGMQEAFVPYMIMNLTVYLVPCLGIAYFIGSIVRSLEVQSGVANVLGLTMAFIGGSFVPQALLSDAILNVAVFTPGYWFVKTNEILFAMNEFTWEALQPLFGYMGIQILFGLAFVCVTLLYLKQRQKNVV